MITTAYCVEFARYNAWMNGKIYRSASTLSDGERKQDQRAFFGSIHRTLAHVLLGDLAWMRRFAPTRVLPCHDIQLTSLDQVLFDDFAAMHEARTTLDHDILAVMRTLSDSTLHGTLHYTRMNGKPNQLPMAIVLMHFFNHQTHHRGQTTTLLSQCGIDFDETDLVYLPADFLR